MNIFRDHQVKRHIVKLFLDRGLTIAANMGYFARKSPSWASVPRRKAAPSCVAFAFSGFSSEEKGTDVNLASHLLMDGFCDFYECAIVVSGDSDLVTPVEMVRDELKKPIGVLNPQRLSGPDLRPERKNSGLRNAATFYKNGMTWSQLENRSFLM